MSEELNLNEMLQIRREKLKNLQDTNRDPFKNEKYDITAYSEDIKQNIEEIQGQNVCLAGRIMSKRGHGKTTFMDIQDSQGRMQLYVKLDALGEDEYNIFKTYDIGDIVGAEGEVFITQKGEISIKAQNIKLLSKSLQILPEKFHGLKDPDLRYRQRYVDLIVNPEVKEKFVNRSKAMKAVREYLD